MMSEGGQSNQLYLSHRFKVISGMTYRFKSIRWEFLPGFSSQSPQEGKEKLSF
jgi:hypothetical protein